MSQNIVIVYKIIDNRCTRPEQTIDLNSTIIREQKVTIKSIPMENIIYFYL